MYVNYFPVISSYYLYENDETKEELKANEMLLFGCVHEITQKLLNYGLFCFDLASLFCVSHFVSFVFGRFFGSPPHFPSLLRFVDKCVPNEQSLIACEYVRRNLLEIASVCDAILRLIKKKCMRRM